MDFEVKGEELSVHLQLLLHRLKAPTVGASISAIHGDQK